MMRRAFFLFALTASFATMALPPARADEVTPAERREREEFFETKIRPLLASRCYECHGPQKQESGLRMDHRESILKGGDSGAPAAVAGDPAKSLILAAVRHEGDYHMPPDEALPPDEVAALVRWVELGLPWPNAEAQPAPLSAAERIPEDRASHWALQPIERPAPPSVQAGDWPRTAVDRFVLAKLEEAGLAPSPPADRRALIRRATLDLTGLPPTREEVEAFLADSSPDAYERLIDRLLASPRYGERWGRHWLDVARYGDTRGYAFAGERRYPYAYTYRDYVIGAFNRDLPYDRFVLEQLAADQLDHGGDNGPLAALGFLTTGRKFNNRHDDIDDQIDVVTRGLMGLTVACARCHDHKYDAIPTDDYYSLYGVFANSSEPSDLPLLGNPHEVAGYEKFLAELTKLEMDRDDFLAKTRETLLDTSRSRVTDYLARVASNQPEGILAKLSFLSLKQEDVKTRLVERWKQWLSERAKADHALLGLWAELTALPSEGFAEKAAPVVAAWRDRPAGSEAGQVDPRLKAALADGEITSKEELARLYGELWQDAYAAWKSAGANDEARKSLADDMKPWLVALLDSGGPLDIPANDLRRYLTRAERNQERELQRKIDQHQANSSSAPPRAMILRDNPNPSQPRVFLRGNAARPGKAVPRQFVALVAGEDRKPYTQGSGRLELAKEIIANDNPLTARVMANRLWLHHFGEPLALSPSDFGVRSEPPAHRELLDWLAWRLRSDGWSLKGLHRQIMLSSAYQQDSRDRPEARRLDPENRLLWRMNRRRLEFESLRDSLLAVSGRLDTRMGGRPDPQVGASEASRRRTVYTLIDRQDLPNLLRVFDFASPDQSAARRPETSVPQQALFLMNSPFMAEQANALAQRARAVGGDPQRQASQLFWLALSRDAEPDELERVMAFLEGSDGPSDSAARPRRWEQLAQLLLMSNEFLFVD